MIVKCAWCGKIIGEKEPLEDKSVTHGICPECVKKYFPEKKEGNPMPLNNEEITEIATRTADKVMDQIRFGGSQEGLAAAKDAVLGVGAYIMPERRGTKGPCTCCIIDPSKPIVPKNLMCTTTGAIGTLKDSEEEELCDELIFVQDGRCARARGLREAAKECKEKYPDDTKRFFECYIPKFSETTGGR